jgi:radical SAM protein with 4Fe4S-binding SPASM domain
MQHSLRRTPELRTDEILALLATMAEMGVYMVTFSGGEPSLRPDLLDILREAKRLGFSFNLFTNGQLSDDLAKEIAALWPRTVGISLYSSVPEIHDATTGLIGSLHRSLRTVRTFVNAGIRVTVKCPLMQHTIYGYKALLELCNELNVLPQFDLHISAAVDGDCTPAIHQIQDEATLRFLLRDPSTALYVGFDVPDVGRQRRPIDDAVCGAGTHLISIAPNGDVYPCNSFPLPVGSVRDDNLTHIRADSPVLAAWNSVTLSDYNECGLHAYCAYCNHCPGMAMTAHGDPLAPHETCCKTARARMAISEALRSGANPETPKEFGRDTTVYLPTRPCVTYSRPDPRRISTDDFTRRIEAIHLQGNPIRTMLHAEEGSPAFEAILAESLPARSRFADLGR